MKWAFRRTTSLDLDGLTLSRRGDYSRPGEKSEENVSVDLGQPCQEKNSYRGTCTFRSCRKSSVKISSIQASPADSPDYHAVRPDGKSSVFFGPAGGQPQKPGRFRESRLLSRCSGWAPRPRRL